ncbi:MAG TPA: DNA alkylation repair protein [Thermoanaerobaculaceae bacterium]|nr:DNA alkylation repair protein [Thermoanaerobaculaceae bacterium]
MTRTSAVSLAPRIEAELRLRGDPERAWGAKRYLKSELVFLGVDTRALRETVKGVLREHAPFDRSHVLALVKNLWPRGIFELRGVAVEVLKARSSLLGAGDMKLIERLLRDSHTWALVDFLAIQVAGPLVVRFPELAATLDRWARDEDFWVRRAAMLALLPPLRRGTGDFERFSRFADGMLEEKEFFIRKAIGWVLRETGKKRPCLVDAWLAPRTQRASGVTVREAVRYLPAARRDALLAAYRDHCAAAPGGVRAKESRLRSSERKG